MTPEIRQACTQPSNPPRVMKSAMKKKAPTKLILKNCAASTGITEYDGDTMRLIPENEPAPKADDKNIPSW